MDSTKTESSYEVLVSKIKAGGAEKYHAKNASQNKMFARERLSLLFDEGEFHEEDGLFANSQAGDLPADGVITATGKVNGQTVCAMANDSTVKAGSWGARTVEKIIRIQETAQRLKVPMFYLVDSAGARITDQIDMFPNRRGAGRIFYNQVKMSGMIPQVCLLFGPSAAGGAYIPAFCDVVIMVDQNASMYLGSPRMAEKVIGEKVTLEEMGGARMHCSVSGCGDILAADEKEAVSYARKYLSYFPANYKHKPAFTEEKAPVSGREISEIVPKNQNVPFDMYEFISRIVDEDSFFEMKKLFAAEIVTGFARIKGRPVGLIANQPKVKGGVLFVDSADKAAKFITLCDAFNIPVIFLADVPGFMIGTKVERAGIIRHGAKLIAAMSDVTVPKLSVIVRKAYGAGLYAMAGPAFEPDCCIALPTAQIAVMGPEAAVNAVYSNKINEIEDPKERVMYVQQKQQEYKEHIDVYKLASELIIDDIVEPSALRETLYHRLVFFESKDMVFSERKHPVYPV
ncbi:acyl-CoA carboxylase subunit beta [Fictibacillus sp. KIGAM418]|uniref:Acyl-CoA carboxylase subunit beta n=1 Tax=Fictibacillus marinisediminis TaxID=2878389 RepID=A0A9X1XB23_9BACL|nr:acyl-CoA carboxylase subunit beta [Fictibacillus marinisediminis]MCK6256906.1 acyl-CoA carboxylase subunit beta [Fictibacillus marinisediminis]